MTKGMYRVALMLGLVAFSATTVEAAEFTGSGDDTTHEVRVVNNYQNPVRVFAQDAEGRLHQLGRVARGEFKVLELSNEIAEMGEVRLKIYPSEPSRSLAGSENGIKSDDFDLQDGAAITVWLESELSQSMIQVDQG